MQRLRALLLCALCLLPTPVWSAWVANGNDHIDSANDAVTEADVSSFSWSCWVNFSSVAALPQQIITHAAAIAGGNFRQSLEMVGSGPVLEFGQGFSGQAFSLWKTTVFTFSASTWYQIGVDYDSNAANDPVLYVNGSSVTITEAAAPSGTRLTGSDSLRIGEDLGGSSDVQGSIAECGFWDRRLTSGEWTNLGVNKWAPSKIPSGLIYYIDLISDAVDRKGATGTLTVTGGTFGTHPPDIVYPRSGQAPVIFQ